MSAKNLNANLLLKSYTFPDIPIEAEIPFDSKIRELQRKFDQHSEKIIIAGATGTGKTVTLTQFAKAHQTRVFSYFLSDNYWILRPSAFLSSLCNQISVVLGDQFDPINSSTDTKIDVERLKLIFERYTQQIVDIAKQNKTTFFFVVDGMEWAFLGNHGERIIDLFPLPSNPKWMNFLGSIRSSSLSQISFSHLVEEPHCFSLTETSNYLNTINPTQQELTKIQEISDGIPGYISLIRKLVTDNQISLSSLLKNQDEIEALIDFQWVNVLHNIEDTEKLILAVIAFSLVPLTLYQISLILKIPVSVINNLVSSSGVLRANKDLEVNYHPDLHRNIARHKLSSYREIVIKKLTQYYETHSNEKSVNLLLPEYYRLQDDYQGIQALLTPTYLTEIAVDNKDLSLIQRLLGNAVELAHNRNDLGVMKYGLTSSYLRNLTDQLIGIREVKALVAIGKYDSALELAYSAKLITLRIRLLAQIYIAMEEAGLTVSRESISEIEQMLSEIDLTNIDPEALLNIASDVFLLVPDAAISLVDKAKFQEGGRGPTELFALLTSMRSNDPECEDLIENIENEELRELALTTSPWLSKLPAQDIIRRGSYTKQTKAKEYLFRQWCMQNRTDPNVHLVIEAALDVIIADPDYRVPLRNLRQLSEALMHCPTEYRLLLARRFDIPNFISMRSPIQERIRLELNIVEALFNLYPEEAKERFQQAYDSFIPEELDTDVACYCLTRFWITLDRIDTENKSNLIDLIKQKLDSEFIRLIDTTADQLEVTTRILRALTLVDPEFAIAYSDMLNTEARRYAGMREVLIAYVQQKSTPLSLQILKKGLAKISDQLIKEQTIESIIRVAKNNKILCDPLFNKFAQEIVEIISDPLMYCKSLAYILTAIDIPKDKLAFENQFADLVETWEKIDVMWIRVEGAFDMATILADVEKSHAESMYEQGKALRENYALANQSVGILFYETLSTATRTVGFLNISDHAVKGEYDNLHKAIDQLPSVLLRTILISQIAVARLRAGDKKHFDELMQEKILPQLETSCPAELKDRALSDIALAIFEYSPEEAKSWVDKLPYSLKNLTWAKTAMRIISNSNICHFLDDNPPNTPIDISQANKILQILDYTDRDQEISEIIHSLTHALTNVHCKLGEASKLDILVKVEAIADKKLPDLKNIQHSGYQILVKSDIERARRLSAIKTRAKILKNHSKIIIEAQSLENIADRVLVLVHLAVAFRDIEDIGKEKSKKKDYQIANDLLEESLSLAPNIPNVQDRADRLEMIADGFSKIHNTDRAVEALRIAKQLAYSLEGIERDRILASVIQTAHQMDKDVAAQISEKIEDFSAKHSLETSINSLDLSKSPQKLFSQYPEKDFNDEVMRLAAIKMGKALNSHRSVSYPEKLVVDWLSTTRNLSFDASKEIANWAVDALLYQIPEHQANLRAFDILHSLLEICQILFSIGHQISFLSAIPSDLKPGFQGLSTNKRLFKVGEKSKAIDYVKNWLRSTAKEYVKICDPYFDTDQLWIIQAVPIDTEVKIITTGNRIGLKPRDIQDKLSATVLRDMQKQERRRCEKLFSKAWKEISDQAPPATLVVVHGVIFDSVNTDEFHDRYILTKDAGLSVGTSLNGFGNKEFFITFLSKDDVKYVSEVYIDPKLRIQDLFSQIIYFEID